MRVMAHWVQHSWAERAGTVAAERKAAERQAAAASQQRQPLRKGKAYQLSPGQRGALKRRAREGLLGKLQEAKRRAEKQALVLWERKTVGGRWSPVARERK